MQLNLKVYFNGTLQTGGNGRHGRRLSGGHGGSSSARRRRAAGNAANIADPILTPILPQVDENSITNYEGLDANTMTQNALNSFHYYKRRASRAGRRKSNASVNSLAANYAAGLPDLDLFDSNRNTRF